MQKVRYQNMVGKAPHLSAIKVRERPVYLPLPQLPYRLPPKTGGNKVKRQGFLLQFLSLMALAHNYFIDNFRSNKNYFVIMETTTDKLSKLLELVDIKDINNLAEALEKVFPEGQNPKVKLKIGWALGNSEDPGNYLSLDFKIE